MEVFSRRLMRRSMHARRKRAGMELETNSNRAGNEL